MDYVSYYAPHSSRSHSHIFTEISEGPQSAFQPSYQAVYGDIVVHLHLHKLSLVSNSQSQWGGICFAITKTPIHTDVQPPI